MGIINNIKERFSLEKTNKPIDISENTKTNNSDNFDNFNFSFFKTNQQIEDFNLKGKIIKSDDKDIKIFKDEIGEQHPFNYNITEGLYKSHGLIQSVVDKYVDYIVGPGFFVKSDNEKSVKIIEDFLRVNNFDTLLRRWVKNALKNGFSPLEIGGKNGEIPKGMKVLNAKYVFVVRDNKGNVKEFNQYFGEMNNISRQKKVEKTKFEPYQISALNFNQVEDDFYGLGILCSTLDNVDRILGLEKDMNILMHRKANAPIHAKIGMLPDAQHKNGIIPDEGAVTAIGQKMYNMRNMTEWATDVFTDISVVDFGKIGDKFSFPLEYERQNLFSSLQIPEVLMGHGNIAEGLADEQSQAFSIRVKSFQAEIEKHIENDIFKRVLLANGIQDVHVEFEWGQPSKVEINNRIEQITKLLENDTLNFKLRIQFEKELALLFNFDDTDLEVPEEERKREEDESVPVVRLQLEKPIIEKPIEKHIHVHEEDDTQCGNIEDRDYSLKEWVGFNLIDYKKNIQKAIDKDDFVALAAINKAQMEAGLFTTPQIEALREIMKDGFKNERSVKQIAGDITDYVEPKNRYKLSKDGELVLGEDGEKILSVSGKERPILIARTETIRLANEGLMITYEDEGIEKYQWLAPVSERTCPICNGLNGDVFKLHNGPKPPAHPNCRCSTVPVVE